MRDTSSVIILILFFKIISNDCIIRDRTRRIFDNYQPRHLFKGLALFTNNPSILFSKFTILLYNKKSINAKLIYTVSIFVSIQSCFSVLKILPQYSHLPLLLMSTDAPHVGHFLNEFE